MKETIWCQRRSNFPDAIPRGKRWTSSEKKPQKATEVYLEALGERAMEPRVEFVGVQSEGLSPRLLRVFWGGFSEIPAGQGFFCGKSEGKSPCSEECRRQNTGRSCSGSEALGIGLVRKILHEARIPLVDHQSYFLG